MARGRSIDLKLPPTRSLTRQREFRARKAARMNQLEEDNASLKAENEALRAQVERLERQIVPPPEADLQLRQSLLIARQELDKALARFGEGMPMYTPGPEYTAHGSLGESSRSSYPPAPPSAASSYSVLPQVMTPSHHDPARRSMTPSVSSQISHQSNVPHVYPVQPMAAPLRRSSSIATSPVQPSAPGVPPFDPNCCGGLFDCSGLPGLPVSNTRYASETPAHPAAVPRSTSLSGPSLRLEVPTRTGSFSGSSYDGTTIVTPTTVIPGTSLPAFGPSNPGYDLASPSDPQQQQQPQSQECCWGMVDCEAGPKPQ